MKKTQFSIQKRLLSFKYAFNGLFILIKEEHNARIHLLAAVFPIALSLILQITKLEWLAIILCIGLVITTEIINSAIENLCDFVSPEKHEMIKRIKDLSAAAVLVAAIIAVFIGAVVFIPKLPI